MSLDHLAGVAATATGTCQAAERHDDGDDWLQLERQDDSGLRVLFQRHKDYVFRLAWGFLGNYHLAEDVTQEVFLRIAKGRSRWRARAKFRTWLYQVTLNTARELRRKHTRESALDDMAEDTSDPSPEHLTSAAVDLQNALRMLSDRQREVVLLRYYEGLSTAEAAEVLRCRQGTVKTHLHRASGILQRLLETPTA